MLDPNPDLPGDTPIAMIGFPTVVLNALILAGLETVGEIRSMGDRDLRRMRRIGPGRLAYLRDAVGRG